MAPKAATAKAAVAPKPVKAGAPRMTLAQVMAELEKAGTEQARKTYTRHGAKGPMFGVSFATLKVMHKRIKVDHELAVGLWKTRNFDARNLAIKIVDPQRLSPADLDAWAGDPGPQLSTAYFAQIASETPHGRAKADAWLKSPVESLRCAGWILVGALALRDESMPDAWFADRLVEIEKSIHAAPNERRQPMLNAAIAIGLRSAALRKAATAAAKRIGEVEVDHGDTACKTSDILESVEKTWAHSTSKGFATPAEHERTREMPRLRC